MTTGKIPTPWRDLVSHNDGAQARAFLATVPAGSDELISLLGHALSRTPLPMEVLDAFADTKRLAPDWIRGVAKHSIDWKAALRWREDKSGREVLEQEMGINFRPIAKDYAARKSIFTGSDVTSYEAVLLAMLDRLPGLATTHQSKRIGVDRTIFELATLPRARDWLARSNLNVLDLLRDGLGPLGNGRVFPGGQRDVDEWVAIHPTYRQAWDVLLEEDQRMIRLQNEWFDQWLSTGRWKDSPLEAWCTHVKQQKRWEGEGPLDHPTMTPPVPLPGNPDLTDQKVAEIYVSEFSGTGRREPYYAAIAANNRLRDALLGGDENTPWAVNYCPINPLGKALYFQEPWGLEMMSTDDGARKIQGLAAQDRRVELALADNSPRQLCQWMIDQPAWLNWRARDGRTLLDLGVERRVKENKVKVIPKLLLMKLAKVAPEILLRPDEQGTPLLERLSATGATKAAVRRQMLTAMAHSTKGRKRDKLRTM